MLTHDILADIKFYNKDEGGRQQNTPSNLFSCIFIINEKKFDCRLLLSNNGAISPGDSKKNIPIKFLSPELIIPDLHEGDTFYLWEIKNIAEGKIIKIISQNNNSCEEM